MMEKETRFRPESVRSLSPVLHSSAGRSAAKATLTALGGGGGGLRRRGPDLQHVTSGAVWEGRAHNDRER